MTAVDAGPIHAQRTSRGRYYTHPTTGLEYPSVTTILSNVGSPEGLKIWAAREAADYAVRHRDYWAGLPEEDARLLIADAHRRSSKNAMGRGSAVHRMAEAIANGEPVDRLDRDRYPGYADAIESWFAEHRPTVVHVEATVWNTTAGYAGSADLHFKWRGGRTVNVLDWKTSKRYGPEMAAQLAAYANATELTTRTSHEPVPAPSVKKGYVVKLADDGTWEMREVNLAAGRKLFAAAQQIHDLHSISATYTEPATRPTQPDPLANEQATIRSRIERIRAENHDALKAVAAEWPADIVTPKHGGPTSLEHCRSIDAFLADIEARYEISF